MNNVMLMPNSHFQRNHVILEDINTSLHHAPEKIALSGSSTWRVTDVTSHRNVIEMVLEACHQLTFQSWINNITWIVDYLGCHFDAESCSWHLWSMIIQAPAVISDKEMHTTGNYNWLMSICKVFVVAGYLVYIVE